MSDIRNKAAYSLGKMLNNEAWIGRLDRGSKPSDIDLIFDNDGCVLFCELSSNRVMWPGLDYGQAWLYKSAIKKGVHCAVLCRHDVDPKLEVEIDTLNDICCFQVMAYEYSRYWLSRIVEGEYWGKFVDAWYRNSDGLRGEVLEKAMPWAS